MDEEQIKIKRSCSLHDLKENNKLAKSNSLENIIGVIKNKSVETKSFLNADKGKINQHKAKTFHDLDTTKLNRIIYNPEKCKLMQKGLDLGLNIKNIVECLVDCDYSDEEKFFEKLIESVVKSSDTQKSNNKEESYDFIESFSIQENSSNNDTNEEFIPKAQTEIQKQKKSTKLNSNLRPVIIDGMDVATR